MSHVNLAFVTAVKGAIRRRSAFQGALVTAVATIGAGAALRRHYLRWGATDDELHQGLAGDEFLPHADQSATRAVTIAATTDAIWPWVAQLGQGRGGFYSYDYLENLLVGAEFHSANRIRAEWQLTSVGDEVCLAPEVPLKVVALEPGRSLVLSGGVPMGKVAAPYEFTWAFVLLAQLDQTTRFVVRERYTYTRRWASLIVQPAQLASCLMSPRMLRGIRNRAEQAQSVSGLESNTFPDRYINLPHSLSSRLVTPVIEETRQPPIVVEGSQR